MSKLKLKNFLLLFLLTELLFAYTPAFAQTPVPFDYGKDAGVSNQIKALLCAPPDTGASTNGVLYQCINQLYKFAIVLAVVIGVFFIVIAGYIYMSADGNTESVDKAKSIIESTIVSLVILLGGWLLLNAINPDLIQFHNVQPPTADLSGVGVGTYGSLPPGCAANSCVIDGFNLASYTPDAGYQAGIASIISGMASYNFTSASGIDSYIKTKFSSSPITGTHVWNASQGNNNVDPKMIVAIMQLDSSLGTQGLGKDDFNPGNIKFVGQAGSTRGPVGKDGGYFANFGNWQTGVNYVAIWLDGHRG